MHQAGQVLRELGHDVVVRDIDYPSSLVYGQVMPRYFRGAYDDVRTLPHQERLDSRTRGFANIGRLISDSRMAKIRAAEADMTARMLRIFDDRDVVITPGAATGPSRVGATATRSRRHARAGGRAGAVPGGVQRDRPAGRRRPVGSGPARAAAVDPVGGRPFDEATLLSLAAEIEADRPWAHRRPPIS